MSISAISESIPAVPEPIPAVPEEVAADFLALPPDARYAAAQFIAFLRQQHAPAPASNGTTAPQKKKPRKPLSEESFVGMWRDRPEMEDSVAYVRALRKREFRDPNP